MHCLLKYQKYTYLLTILLDKNGCSEYNSCAIGVWRSLVSRLVRVQEAMGSNPVTPTSLSSHSGLRCGYSFF